MVPFGNESYKAHVLKRKFLKKILIMVFGKLKKEFLGLESGLEVIYL